MFEYRKATADDIESLSRLRVDMLCEGGDQPEVFRETLYQKTAAFFADGLQTGMVSAWLAEEGGKAVAVCCVNYFMLPPNGHCVSGRTAYVGNLYTAPECRRRGVATHLFRLAVAEAEEQGCGRILLNPTAPGRALYVRHGFAPWSEALALYPGQSAPPKTEAAP